VTSGAGPLRRRVLAAGTAVALGAAGFALAGESGTAADETSDLTLTEITSVTESLPTSVTTSVPTTAPSVSVATTSQERHQRRHVRRRARTTSTAATTAAPFASTAATTTKSPRRRPTTVAAAVGTTSGSIPRWAIAGIVIAGALIAVGLGGLYATRARGR
jgi:hypothetical protein